MNVYVDTSLIVAACTSEMRSNFAQKWLQSQDAGVLLMSEWTRTEFAAAISMKVRSGQLPAAERADAFAAFRLLVKDSFHIAPVSTSDFINGGRLAEQSNLGLRAGDALHLAICHAHGASLATFDKDQHEASLALGIPAVSP